MTAQPPDPVFTNIRLYRKIAIESLREAEDEMNPRRTPRSDGSGGDVITYDPDERSFKCSMIAIVFAGMYIEARLWLHGCKLVGIESYKGIDKQPLEERMKPLGLTDTGRM
jgi:hypothetical protein